MWNLAVLSDVFDQYTSELREILQCSSSESLPFLDACKKLLFKSILAIPPEQVGGVIFGGFYVNNNELSHYWKDEEKQQEQEDIDWQTTIRCQLKTFQDRNDVLCLRTPFVVNMNNPESTELCIHSYFTNVLNSLFDTILLAHKQTYTFTSPIPILNVGIDSYNKQIENSLMSLPTMTMTSNTGMRLPHFIFLGSINYYPTFIADCNLKISNSISEPEILETIRFKYKTMDYLNQLLLFFQFILSGRRDVAKRADIEDNNKPVDQLDQPVQLTTAKKVDQPDQPTAADQPDQPTTVDQPDQPTAVDQPDQLTTVDQPDQPVEVVDQPNKHDQLITAEGTKNSNSRLGGKSEPQ